MQPTEVQKENVLLFYAGYHGEDSLINTNIFQNFCLVLEG